MSVRIKRLDQERVAHRSESIIVRECGVERDGVRGSYTIVDRPDAIVVIPLTPTNRTVLLRQFRVPTNDTAWELPMGGIDAAEPLDAAARRELMEEVGLRATDLVRIGEYRPAPGLTPQRTTVFLARVGDADLDASLRAWRASEEIQEIASVPLPDVDRMVAGGLVTDGFSLSAILLLRLWLEQREKRPQ